MSFVVEGLTVRYAGAVRPALLDASLKFEPGVHTAIANSSVSIASVRMDARTSM